ncbi:hypothetical protein EDB89DRAFT_1963994 [Lactarius sanguifluus]|nr:hypothetical protein EDB89DRAFT_1963994 [Lactarius sanguifluus]
MLFGRLALDPPAVVAVVWVACAHRAARHLEWLVWCRGCCCSQRKCVDSEEKKQKLILNFFWAALTNALGAVASQWNTQRRVRENV